MHSSPLTPTPWPPLTQARSPPLTPAPWPPPQICFWLIENGFSVLIAACDTFRAGAVEQLRTHTRHLNALHPAEKHGGRQMVQLYEKGYGESGRGAALVRGVVGCPGWGLERRDEQCGKVVRVETWI